MTWRRSRVDGGFSQGDDTVFLPRDRTVKRSSIASGTWWCWLFPPSKKKKRCRLFYLSSSWLRLIVRASTSSTIYQSYIVNLFRFLFPKVLYSVVLVHNSFTKIQPNFLIYRCPKLSSVDNGTTLHIHRAEIRINLEGLYFIGAKIYLTYSTMVILIQNLNPGVHFFYDLIIMLPTLDLVGKSTIWSLQLQSEWGWNHLMSLKARTMSRILVVKTK
jgi:hypothetical protein